MRTLAMLLGLTLSVMTWGHQDAVVIIHTGEVERRFEVEVADTPATRSQGLMHRQELAENAGMLFVFERPAEVGFWMRNTYIPLDMLFVDRHGEIVHIHHEARPHDETLIRSGTPVTHVLEINGGLAARLGIETGQRMQILHPEVGTAHSR